MKFSSEIPNLNNAIFEPSCMINLYLTAYFCKRSVYSDRKTGYYRNQQPYSNTKDEFS